MGVVRSVVSKKDKHLGIASTSTKILQTSTSFRLSKLMCVAMCYL